MVELTGYILIGISEFDIRIILLHVTGFDLLNVQIYV
jgi:hypothetical protein